LATAVKPPKWQFNSIQLNSTQFNHQPFACAAVRRPQSSPDTVWFNPIQPSGHCLRRRREAAKAEN
jgi:hypothetical protein